MSGQTPQSLIAIFEDLPDPRVDRTKRHKLVDVVVIAICAPLCGADSWPEVELFGRCKQAWLATVLELPNGIPSHDTFNRVFARLDPNAFGACFQRWLVLVRERLSRSPEAGAARRERIAIDGKTSRRTHDRKRERDPLHLVSAWAAEARLVLGQQAVDTKSNEITAIPELLKMLDVSGCIVTIDALGTQTKIAKAIVEGEGDYVLAAKGNQGTLEEDIALFFSWLEGEGARHQLATFDTHETLEPKTHGRAERRRVTVTSDVEWLRGYKRWRGLKTIAMVESWRTESGHTSQERRYYISSLEEGAERMGEIIRGHWSVENSLHWVLDIALREDDSRVRTGNGPENLAILRHMALNLLAQERSTRVGVKAKRHRAGWDNAYLLKVLGL